MDTMRIRQTIAATMLAVAPVTGGAAVTVAVTHSLDRSIDEVRGLAPAEVEPPGVALGAHLAEEDRH